MRSYLFALMAMTLTGCVTNSQQVLVNELHETIQESVHEENALQTPLVLDDEVSHQERIARYLEGRSEISEFDKIAFLLSAMRSSDAVFVRNGGQYNGMVCAKWLRWKMTHPQYRNNPVLTARDFVTRVADCSRRTWKPYRVIFADGREEDLQTVLASELNLLETAIRQKAVADAIEQQTFQIGGQSQDVQAPVMVTSRT